MIEWSSLAEPIVAGHSPWAGARIQSETDAQHALDLVDHLARDTIPTARRQLDEVLAETQLAAPASVEDWRRTLGLLTALSTTLSLVGPGVFELDLDYIADVLTSGSRSRWHRMVAFLFRNRYRKARKIVRELLQHFYNNNGVRLK
ncbi:MAG: hypothetical protein M3O70_06775, partial [Actinomycetota bacterium]|nr:hypothetical protein [Actinomycetota bacterium]